MYTLATGERVFDQGKQQVLEIVDGKVRGLNTRVARAECRGVVSLRGAGATPWLLDSFATTASERVEVSWPRRQSTTKCTLIMTLHASPAPSESEPCPSVRRGKKEKITMPAGQVPYRSSDAHLTSRSFVSATTTIGIDYGYL